MTGNITNLISRQYEIACGSAEPLPLPKYNNYAICNLRGGIGKTSLAFNLSYLTDNILMADTCPQGNLSYFYDNQYYSNTSPTVYDMLLQYFMLGYGSAGHVAQNIAATNEYFTEKNSFYLPSSPSLYMLPSQIANALVQAKTMPGANAARIIDNMLFSLKAEIEREMTETGTNKYLIDTSPFFAGATHLAWHATDALIVPVRTDQQSINSLSLLLNTLSNPSSEFRLTMPSNNHEPKIQMVVLTHCGWSTRPGARHIPNQQTKVFLEKIRDIVNRNISRFTTTNPDNHILLLDDFLGTGRMSTAQSKPIELLREGDSVTINRIKTCVNHSVEKVKNQLKYINTNLW